MSGKSWIFIFSIFFGSVMAGVHMDENETASWGDNQVALIAPYSGKVIGYGDLLVVWRSTLDPPQDIGHWEINLLMSKSDWTKTLVLESVQPLTASQFSARVPAIRSYCQMPGRYIWRITAVLKNGRRISSQFGRFSIGVRSLENSHSDVSSRFEVKFHSLNRRNNQNFRQFLTGVINPEPFKQYSDLEMIFHQGGRGRFHFKEKLILHSQVGMGGGVSVDMRLCRNEYFSLHPEISNTVLWRSAGLKNYSSTESTWRIGCNVVVQPQGYVTLKGAWIPSNRIRYATVNRELRTFDGKGWEFGVRFVLSHQLINPFNLLGLEVDLQRMPIEYYFGEIKDSYSGMKIKHFRLSIGFIL